MEKSEFEVYQSLEELPTSEQELIAQAQSSLPMSYAPYSSFHVAASIRLSDGRILTGVNQENASSPAGLCAEQVTLYRKGVEAPDAIIVAMAIVAVSDRTLELPAISPCGNCRQVMLEFVQRQDSSFPVIMQGSDGQWLKIFKMESLLPFGFTSNSL